MRGKLRDEALVCLCERMIKFKLFIGAIFRGKDQGAGILDIL